MADDTTSRIALARDQLTEKLTELRRREARVRTVIAPLRHLAHPWVGIAVAALVGYRIGRPRTIPSAAPPANQTETLTRAIVRASVVVVAQGLARHAVATLVDRSGDR